jgi:NitT/TauT family transport system substrate-binding protein
MYGGEEPLKMYAAFANISVEDAHRIREEFDPKEMLIADRVLGIAQLVPDAMKFKFIPQALTEEQLKELVQIP